MRTLPGMKAANCGWMDVQGRDLVYAKLDHAPRFDVDLGMSPSAVCHFTEVRVRIPDWPGVEVWEYREDWERNATVFRGISRNPATGQVAFADYFVTRELQEMDDLWGRNVNHAVRMALDVMINSGTGPFAFHNDLVNPYTLWKTIEPVAPVWPL